ncbi:MAG: methylmalonyl-CoA mutase family protein [Flavobacteriaceae bacterium]
MKQKLFSEFKSNTNQEVWSQILKDLNGLDLKSTLYWESLDGITTQPIYDRESNHSKRIINSFPEQWSAAHTLDVELDIESLVHSCKALVELDTEVVFLSLKNEKISFKNLFEALKPFQIKIYFVFYFIPNRKFLEDVESNLLNQNNCFLLFDPIASLAKTGDWMTDQKTDMEYWSQLIRNSKQRTPIYVDTRIHQNAGATIPQQLAYGISQAVDYLSLIELSSIDEVEILFHLAVGSNYFFEIAKIQALKTVFSQVSSIFNFRITFKIIAEPSKRNMTLQDYNNNMLRTTTAMMAAILGGADFINNLAYDSIINPPNNFGDRIAQNQLLILKNESYFDKVTNPIQGSYYIEKLTEEFAELSLEQFKYLETNHGFLNQLLHGKIQKEIQDSADKEQFLFDSGDLVLVGSNKYQDHEASKTVTTLQHRKTPKAGVVKPIIEKRLAEKTESS